jgi:hypothetical protein
MGAVGLMIMVTSKQIATRMMNENWDSNEKLRRYLIATNKEDCVTGKLGFDTCCAALRIVELANKSGFTIPDKDLAKVAHSIIEWLKVRGVARMKE